MSSPYQKIELFISCRNLKDTDYFSKSDPFVKVYFRRDFNVKQYALYGRTQTRNNELNPNFTKSFEIDYIFQSRQDIRFDVFDDDNGNDDFLGSCQTTIGALMGAKNQTSIFDLKIQNKNAGKIVVRCEKLTQSNEFLKMKFRGVKLMNTDSIFDFWDKSDPYLKFLKIRDDNTYVEMGRTNTINNNLNPVWNPIQISLPRLINPNFGKFRIQCWDWQENGKDNFIGQLTIQMNQLLANQGPKQFVMNNPKKKKPGNLLLQEFSIIKRPSFVDYLRGGLQLNMMIAIDFTGSNGTPTSPSSLHYMNSNSMNQYQTAIMSIANILLNYDSDKRIPCFGFGAQPRFPGWANPTVSHCFPLSGSYQTLQAMGMQHLQVMYQNAVMNVSFSGPTYFANILQQTMKLAYQCKNQGSKVYQTLLILTDGEIHDMSKTIDLVCQATNLPYSVIIVGVGNADFSNMQKLDGDGGLYNSQGQRAARDIVQFVPFRQVNLNPDILAKQLLAQLPGQIVQYMQCMGIPPKVPPQVPQIPVVNQVPPVQENQIIIIK